MTADRDHLRALQAFVAALMNDHAPAPNIVPAIPVELLRRHHLGPLAYKAGDSRFRDEYVASGLAATHRRRILAEAALALAAADIPVAPIKGIAYTGTLYPDPADRPMADIDLLVPPGLATHAEAALESLGFRHRPSRIERAAVHHTVTLCRDQDAIDLHWSIVQPHRSRIDLPGIWARARPATDLGATAYRLEPSDLGLLHLIHIARTELMVPAIAYLDAVRLLRTLETPALLASARQWRLSRAVGAALATTEALAGRASWRPSILPDLPTILAAEPQPRVLQILRKARLLEGPAELAGLARVFVAERWPG